MSRHTIVRIIVLALTLMLLGTAMAAQWPEGRSASKPYSNKPEVDLTQKVGYIILYPRDRNRMAAHSFCNNLEIYLPREDVAIGQGRLHLYHIPEEGGEAVEAAYIDFDSGAAYVRPLTEEEMAGLMWGGGVCVEILLPVSLEFSGSYYVLMDEGCFTAGGTLPSPAIANPTAWVPVLTGDYGISGMRYTAPVPEADEAEGEASPEAQAEAAVPDWKAVPEVGDVVSFEVVLGGDAAYAVIYSPNDSVAFETIEFDQTSAVQGVVTKDEVKWGVVFLNANSEVVEAIDVDTMAH